MKYTVGADPEGFLKEINGEFLPSEFFFSGSKDNPENENGGYATLCDNLMVEFNIPPAESKLQFVSFLNQGIEFIQQKLPEEVKLVFNQSAKFNEDFINLPSAKTFGCAPQSNMYGIESKNYKDIPKNTRFAGGHIHLGVPEGIKDLPRMVKCFDLFVGLPLLSDEEFSGKSRKNFYGNPGTYRITSYGFEYRAPSCEWLSSNKSIEWVWDAIERAITIYCEEDLNLPSDNIIIEAFNSKERALTLIKEYSINQLEIA